jgi:hypothetical protein
MRRTLLASLAVLAVGAVSAAAWMASAGQTESWEEKPRTPFTAHATQIVTGPGGYVGPHSMLYTLAARSDGSYAKRQTNIHHDENLMMTTLEIWDQSLGRRALLSPAARVRTSYRLAPGPYNTPHGCSPSRLEGRPGEEFLGYSTVEVLHEEESLQNRRLFAPGLDCLMVYSESRVLDYDGSAVQVSRYQVTAIQLGEPHASFFEVPDEYSELPPTEAFGLHLKAAGVDDERVERAVAQESPFDRDAHYFANLWPGALD